MRAGRPSPKQPGFSRGPRIADLMTVEYKSFLDSSFAAERSGDAATALEYHLGIPMFTRGRHIHILEVMASLADEMTPWLWARWAAYQCNRAEDPGTESGFITRAALDYTLQMFYDGQMEAAYVDGRDPVKLMARVMGESWIYHQVCTFELGGLAEFLDFLADGPMAESAEWARSWDGAPMRGLRLESSTDGRLVVTDLKSRREVELLDLGAGTLCEPGGFLVGRLVGSGTAPETMFDTTPVVVDQLTAQEVAASTRGGWITAFTKALADGRVDLSALESEDRELATDVPSLALIEAGTRPPDLPRVMQQLRDGRDEVGRAAFRILRGAAEGTFGPDDRSAYVAAAVLNPHAYDEAKRELVTPGRDAHWLRWAELVPAPAASRLTRLAEMSAAEAA
jgi:hypothetical protein